MVGLRQFGSGQKGLISVGLLSSVAKNLLPRAAGICMKNFQISTKYFRSCTS